MAKRKGSARYRAARRQSDDSSDGPRGVTVKDGRLVNRRSLKPFEGGRQSPSVFPSPTRGFEGKKCATLLAMIALRIWGAKCRV